MEREMFPSYETEEILALCQQHAEVYTEDDKEAPVVQFHDNTSAIDANDRTIKLNPADAWMVKEKLDLSEEEAIRVLLDTLSHEIGHYNWTDLDSKREFAEQYPRQPKVAGGVQNIVEDLYIDANRVTEFEGLKLPFDRVTESRLPNYIERCKDQDHLGEKMMDILTITARGEVDCPLEFDSDFLQEYVEMLERELSKVPDLHEQEERLEVAHKITSTILDNVEKPEEIELLEELLDELIEEMAEELGMEKPSERKERQEETVEEHSEELEAEPEKEEESDDEETNSSEEETEEEIGEAENSKSSSESGEDEEEEEEASGGQSEDEDDELEVEDPEIVEDDEDFEPDDEEMEDWKNTDPEKVRLGGDGNDVVIKTEESKTESLQLSERVSEVLEELEEETATRKVNTSKGPELDVKKAVRRAAGDPSETELFRKEMPIDTEDRVIGITLDGSGSMNHPKGSSPSRMDQALKAVGAIGKATKEVGDEFVANVFRSLTSDDDADKKDLDDPNITEELTGLNEEFKMDHLERATADGRDPLALGLSELAKEIRNVDADEKVIFAVTDGNPSITLDGDFGVGGQPYQAAVDEAEEEVEELRKEGFKIKGIAAGDDPRGDVMDQMFGEGQWFRFDPENLDEKLLTIYRNKVK